MAVYLEDKRLVKQLLAGDERAFDRFFAENFARLFRFALVRLSGGALEVVQRPGGSRVELSLADEQDYAVAFAVLSD